MVEQEAVNFEVAGSSPASGAMKDRSSSDGRSFISVIEPETATEIFQRKIS